MRMEQRAASLKCGPPLIHEAIAGRAHNEPRTRAGQAGTAVAGFDYREMRDLADGAIAVGRLVVPRGDDGGERHQSNRENGHNGKPTASRHTPPCGLDARPASPVSKSFLV